MNWYIGQEVVCVDDKGATSRIGHKKLVKNKVYTIQALRVSECKCKNIQIHVGIFLKGTSACSTCSHESHNTCYEWWFSERRFAPLMDISELKEILNEEIQRV